MYQADNSHFIRLCLLRLVGFDDIGRRLIQKVDNLLCGELVRRGAATTKTDLVRLSTWTEVFGIIRDRPSRTASGSASLKF